MSEAGRALIRVTWVWGSLLWRGVLCWHGLGCPPGGVAGLTRLEALSLWGLFGLLVSYLEKNKTNQKTQPCPAYSATHRAVKKDEIR